MTLALLEPLTQANERQREHEETHRHSDKQKVSHCYLLSAPGDACGASFSRTCPRRRPFVFARQSGWRSEATYRISSGEPSCARSSICAIAGRFTRTHAAIAPNIKTVIRLSVIGRKAPSGVRTSESAKSPMPTSKITTSAGHAGAAGEGRPFPRRRD